jgi:phenylalanyl-tRNA synthetase alpha subunit
MISKDQEEVYKRVTEENSDLRDCLRQLQREIMDVVRLKSDIFASRFRAEHGKDLDSEDKLNAKIELIRDELFNLNFEESGKDLIEKFKLNFQKLKEFMSSVDKEIQGMAVFNTKEDQFSAEVITGEDSSKYANVSSVQQLRLLLRNYEGICESQHHLLN